MMGCNPYGFAPYQQQLGAWQMQNQMMQAQPAQNQQMQQNSGPDWIMASTVKQVEQISVQPGQKAWVMVQNEPVFALRAADNMGLVTTDYYRFEKISPDAMETPIGDYVTRKEFDDFVRDFNGLVANIQGDKGEKK